MPPPLIAGLYFYCRDGARRFPARTAAELPQSLRVNPGYRDRLVVYAGDHEAAQLLEKHGLTVHRVLDDAPESVRRDSAHKMKHWMCLQALEEFGEYLWVDWDTVLLRPLDDALWDRCRASGTPKFVRIANYWATVNCGVYYCPGSWAERLRESFDAPVSEPNDELLWRSVLPADVLDRPEFWWGEWVENIWSEAEFARVGPATYFAHVKELGWAEDLRRRAASGRPSPSRAR